MANPQETLTIPEFAHLAAARGAWRLVDWFPHDDNPPGGWRTLRLYAPGAASSADTWWLAWNGHRLEPQHEIDHLRRHHPGALAWLLGVLETAPKPHTSGS